MLQETEMFMFFIYNISEIIDVSELISWMTESVIKMNKVTIR